MLLFGVLFTYIASAAGFYEISKEILYSLLAMLLIAAVGLLARQNWAKTVAIVVSWLNVLIFAVLVVPDRDEAMLGNLVGLNVTCGLLAAYFVVCAILIRRNVKTKVEEQAH